MVVEVVKIDDYVLYRNLEEGDIFYQVVHRGLCFVNLADFNEDS